MTLAQLNAVDNAHRRALEQIEAHAEPETLKEVLKRDLKQTYETFCALVERMERQHAHAHDLHANSLVSGLLQGTGVKKDAL